MKYYGRSCMKSEKLTITHQIGNFSVQLRKGLYSTPVYKSSASKWNLSVDSGGDFIHVYLNRSDISKDQYVDVKLSIVDCFGLSSLYADKDTHFKTHDISEKVLSLKKDELFGGFCGNRKLRLVPNDLLTLKCVIVIYEDYDQICENKQEFESSFNRSHNFFNNDAFQWLLRVAFILLAAGIIISTLICFYFYFILPFFENVVQPFMQSLFIVLEAFAQAIMFLSLLGIVVVIHNLCNESNRHYRKPFMSVGTRQSAYEPNRGRAYFQTRIMPIEYSGRW